MRTSQILATVAGLAVASVTGWVVFTATPAAADQPHQPHPGQPVPRTGAPANGHSSGGHAQPAGGHSTNSHGSTSGSTGHGSTGHGSSSVSANANSPAAASQPDSHVQPHGDAHGEHADGHAPAAPDQLMPTYFGETPDADTALMVLSDGNTRWVTGHTQNPNSDESARRETAENGQHPFATILTCADSRIPVERVFDRGVGELFVIRVAGNVVAETEAGTIEYGVEHLHTPVIVVMGHTGCGAVKAAVDGAETHGNVRFLIGEIEPSVRRAATVHPSAEGEELVNATVRENVMQSMFDLLATSESVRTAVDNGTVRLVGAVYDIGTGEVEWIGTHPWQDGLISVLNNRNATQRDQATAEATGGRDGH